MDPEEKEYEWKTEIQIAVESFESDLEWQILASVIEEEKTIGEIADQFDVSIDEVVDSVGNLQRGGLVSKKMGPTPEYSSSPVEFTTWGKRIVASLDRAMYSDSMIARASFDRIDDE